MNNLKITPMGTNFIGRLIEQESMSAGGIQLVESSLEKSSLVEVLIPNSKAYHPNGDPKHPELKEGMRVRVPKGEVGTGMPEAPVGETWLAIPEDMVEYIVE